MRVYAIGDVHGRLDLLERVLAMVTQDLAARPVLEAVVVFLGDYVDRGPDSHGVLELLAAGAPAQTRHVLLKGNHEEMLMRFLDDASFGAGWRQLGGMETLLSYRVQVNQVFVESGHQGLREALCRCLPPHHLELLSRLATSWTAGDYFFCHAGVRPRVPLDQQRPEDLLWIRAPFVESRDDFGKVVVHGHSPVETPQFHANRINIDTGAYVTNRLTCLVLENADRGLLMT